MPLFPATIRRLSSDFRIRLSTRTKDEDYRTSDPASVILTSRSQQQQPSCPASIPTLEQSYDAPPSPNDEDWLRTPPPEYEETESPFDDANFMRPPELRQRLHRLIPRQPHDTQNASSPNTPSHGSGVSASSESQLEPESQPEVEDGGAEAAAEGPSRLGLLVDSVSLDIWNQVATYCSPATSAALAMMTRTLAEGIGERYFQQLNLPNNKSEKIRFLLTMEEQIPNQVLCFVCAQFHRRCRDNEQISGSCRSVPVFQCPAEKKRAPIPKLRLTYDRDMPFTLAQLAMRASRFSPEHGIKMKALSKHWKDPYSDWDHRTKFMILNGHLLMRVRSMIYVRGGLMSPEMRLLMLDRADYAPYFSVCQHWASEGALTSLCKCALRHVPAAGIPSSCAECRPLRRCYHCPTEYLIQTTLKETKDEYGHTVFRHALLVTRWSDLGTCVNPFDSKEWLACNGQGEYEPMQRSGDPDGINTLRRRFESALGVRVIQARALPLRMKEEWKSTNRLLWTEEQRWLEDQKHDEGKAVLGGGTRGRSFGV